jgi:dTDP-4-dehydrorhamnose 3,5-epimerase
LIFQPTGFDGLWVIEPVVHEDPRGFFLETYRRDEFAKRGLAADFVQDNHSASTLGVLRGLHYQVAPRAQDKLLRVVAGEIFDAVVDLRRGSPTLGRSFCIRLSAENRKMLFVPAGFAHGFLTLSERAEVIYKVSQPYSPEHERGLRWNDPKFAIAWPRLGREAVLSEKDARYPVWDGTAL